MIGSFSEFCCLYEVDGDYTKVFLNSLILLLSEPYKLDKILPECNGSYIHFIIVFISVPLLPRIATKT
jgi:hypothetical protein